LAHRSQMADGVGDHLAEGVVAAKPGNHVKLGVVTLVGADASDLSP